MQKDIICDNTNINREGNIKDSIYVAKVNSLKYCSIT